MPGTCRDVLPANGTAVHYGSAKHAAMRCFLQRRRWYSVLWCRQKLPRLYSKGMLLWLFAAGSTKAFTAKNSVLSDLFEHFIPEGKCAVELNRLILNLPSNNSKPEPKPLLILKKE
ncbi:hypothetical protein NPIL_312101 [Nephila pilipes]|uniref:Uncharacterized protein n=1 Tax=Nephila pilipes TaxID=299642 RepID=A0A8X6NPL6_NEPPI|nr:hypothetical protein NPIL_312101 [Nephila pilipes]